MITALARYPETKASDLPWLGDIPVHWQVCRAKVLFRPVDVRSVTGTEDLLTVSSKHGVVPRALTSVTMFQAKSYIGHKLCWPGDLVINSLWAWGGGLGVSPRHGIVSTAYGVYRPRPEFAPWSPYFHELVRSQPFQWELQVRSKGIWISRLQLTDEAFLAAPIPVPPAADRDAIVRFIDHADRRIRRAISAKQKLIAMLNEQKQAVIHRAVTRGLDPNVKLKPSGVDWLGDVPEHWDVSALRFRYSQWLGKMLDSKQQTGSNQLPYLRNIDVQWDRINTKELPTMDIAPSEYERYTVRTGDLLVCEGGELGRSAIWSGDLETCGFQKALHRLRPRSGRDLPRFQYYALRAAASADAFSDGHESTISHLTGEKLRAHRFPFPPTEEQAQIAAYLDGTTDRVEAAIDLARDQIALLREYRTRLIADIITGKLDVREAAADLSDEPDELEPLDEVDDERTAEPRLDDLEAVEA